MELQKTMTHQTAAGQDYVLCSDETRAPENVQTLTELFWSLCLKMVSDSLETLDGATAVKTKRAADLILIQFNTNAY